MNITVERETFSSLSVTGVLTTGNGFRCFTLEPPWKTDGTKPRTTPFGDYQLTIRWSFKHKRMLPHVESVPGFEAIEIHIGNFPQDTDGCTLVGLILGPQPNFIGQSTKAFAQLFSILFQEAVLTNPDSPEQNHVYNVGQISYIDGRTTPSDLDGEISV